MSKCRLSASRSKKILDLVKTDSTTQQKSDEERPIPDSPLPASCNFGDSEWATLEGMIDEELSSDRNWSSENFTILEKTIPNTPTPESSDRESFILDSSEHTPTRSPLKHFDISVQIHNDNSNHNITSSCPSPSSLVPTEIENQNQLTLVDSPLPIASVSSLITASECDSPSTSVISNLKRKTTLKKNPGKKRKKCVENWIDNKRKQLLNSGQKYTTRKGKVKTEKKLRPVCSTTCKFKCYDKFNTETRENIKKHFWNLGDHAKQWEYINKFSEKNNKKSITVEGPSRRKYTTKYFLPLPKDSGQPFSSYKSVQVCLKTFLNTLCITDQIIRTAHSKLNQEGITLHDDRGKHPNHPVVRTAEMIKSVCDHVTSFQPVPSHYTRQSSTKVYLDNNLSMRRMFLMYKEWDQLKNYDSKALTLRQYSDIVNENLNIGFFVPKKDICDRCHSFENESNPTEELVSAQSQHIENKKTAREFKDKDKQAAQNSSEVVCATFDFQKILNCPHGDVSLLYYKRKLAVYNFTVFDVAKKEGYCYMWTECTGKRGANEVSSCLMTFMKSHIDRGVKKFLFWSDNCSGHNRNRVVYSMYMYLSNLYKVDITHRFLEKGHTQNEGDSVHALIEKESKGKLIYTPDQWYALVRWAKTNGKPYNVIEICQQDIFNFKPFLNERNWKKDTKNCNVSWNKIKEIMVAKDVPNCLFIKYDLKGEQHCLNCVITRSRKKIINKNEDLKTAYDNTLAITEAKYKDLLSLCDAGVIPREYHTFYKNLKCGTNSAENESDSD